MLHLFSFKRCFGSAGTENFSTSRMVNHPPISDLTPADILLSTVTDLVGLESTAHLPSLDSRAVTFFLDKMGWSTAIDGQEGEKLAELIDMPFEGDQLWPLVGAMREYFHHFFGDHSRETHASR